jgi:hypothetical protein
MSVTIPEQTSIRLLAHERLNPLIVPGSSLGQLFQADRGTARTLSRIPDPFAAARVCGTPTGVFLPWLITDGVADRYRPGR